MISVNRTTYVPFWTVGTDRWALSHWPNGWALSRRTDRNYVRAIYVPGFVIWL